MNRIFTIGSAAILLLLAGCVSKVIEEDRPPKMMIAQNSDGDVTMTWESKLGYLYTVYCQKTQGGDWVVLQGVNRLPGTGETMSARDRSNPRMPPRRYRVLPEKP